MKLPLPSYCSSWPSPILWFVLCKILASLGGFSRHIKSYDLGVLQTSHNMVSAKIGLLNISNCLRVDLYQQGMVLKLWKIIGGGSRIIRFADIQRMEKGIFFSCALPKFFTKWSKNHPLSNGLIRIS